MTTGPIHHMIRLRPSGEQLAYTFFQEGRCHVDGSIS